MANGRGLRRVYQTTRVNLLPAATVYKAMVSGTLALPRAGGSTSTHAAYLGLSDCSGSNWPSLASAMTRHTLRTNGRIQGSPLATLTLISITLGCLPFQLTTQDVPPHNNRVRTITPSPRSFGCATQRSKAQSLSANSNSWGSPCEKVLFSRSPNGNPTDCSELGNAAVAHQFAIGDERNEGHCDRANSDYLRQSHASIPS